MLYTDRFQTARLSKRPVPAHSNKTKFIVQVLFAGLVACSAQAATVRDFGASGNGSSDDTAAIQNAINATPAGATLTFPAGTYRVTSTLQLKSGVTYQGQNSPVLLGYQGTSSGGYGIFDGSGASNVTITGITFDGGGSNFGQGPGNWSNNINITNNTFRNMKNQGQQIGLQCGIYLDWVQNINITNNVFSFIMDGGAPTLNYWTNPQANANGIRMFHVSHIVIADNAFDYVGQGISMSQIADASDLTDIQIRRNRFTRTYRMAIEIQSGSEGHPLTGLVIDHNVGYNWVNPYPDSFGVSLASYSLNAQMTNNFWDASPPNPGHTFGMCFEVDGDSTLVEGNTCIASNNPVGWGTTNANAVVAGVNAVIRNNTFCGGPQTIGTETSWATYQAYNNAFPACGPVVAPPGTGTTADTTPPSVPAGLAATSTSTTQIALYWNSSTDNVGVSGYRVYRNGSMVATVSGNAYQDSGLTASTLYSYKVLAYDAAGNQSAQSAAVSGTTLTPGAVSHIQSDDFHATSLSSMWTFLNPMSDATLRLNGTQLIIGVPGGTEHDVWTSGNFAPRIMQAASNGDFEVEVKFDSLVSAASQMQGIIAEQNGSNFLRFDVYHDGSTPHVFAATFTGGQATVRVDNPVSLGSGSLWLRLKRTGTSWTGSISLDGTTFNVVAQFTQALSLVNIGPFAGNCCGSTSPAFNSTIDYFFNTASPISPQDGGGPVLTNIKAVSAAGGATITWTTDRAATTQVKYGLASSYGSSTPVDLSMVTSHAVALSGLACAKTYHYAVASANAGGANPSISSDGTLVTSACAATRTVVSDNFNNTALNTGLWSFVNPVGDATVRLNGKQAVIAIPAGKSHDVWTPSNLSARLMQTAPDTDFEVEMKLDSAVGAEYQMQGILIEQDNANYLRFDVYYDGSSARLFAATFTGGAPTVRVDNPITKGGPVWLRLNRTGSTWTGSYSFDGNAFVTGVTFTQQMRVAKAGLFAGTAGGNGGPAPAFTALIGYWFNTASRLVP